MDSALCGIWPVNSTVILFFGYIKFLHNFAFSLRYGVMVALQILVLSVKVRILVSQHKRGLEKSLFVFYTQRTQI